VIPSERADAEPRDRGGRRAPILYYALGGGHGHVLRGLAILRALGRGTLLLPPRLAEWAQALGVDYRLPPSEDAHEVGAWLAALPAPALLLVDVFPRGAVGEIGSLLERAPAWLITRGVRPAAYLQDRVRASIESRYERLLWVEEPSAALRALRLPQLDVGLVLLETERLERAAARAALGLSDAGPLLLGLGSGTRLRQARLCRLLGKIAERLGAALRFVSTELPPQGPIVRCFPSARVLLAADVIVTAAGYHAFHETALAGVPTAFIPQRRALDDQWSRCAGRVLAHDPAALEEAVRRLLRLAPGPLQPYPAGASRVAALVERRVEQGVLGEEEVATIAGR
jgi:hypothetical protein